MIVTSLNYLPSENSSDQQWIDFYEQMAKEVGSSNAGVLWTKAWAQRKNEGLLGSSADTSNLRSYMATVGINIQADGLFGFAVNGFNSLASSVESAFNIGKWIFLIIAILVIIPVFMMAMNLAKNPGEALKVAAE
jgi:hypothetical protein